MSKLIFIMLFLAGFAFASKPLVLEICNPNFCYVQIIPDAKKWQYEYDFTGKKFIKAVCGCWYIVNNFLPRLTIKDRLQKQFIFLYLKEILTCSQTKN